MAVELAQVNTTRKIFSGQANTGIDRVWQRFCLLKYRRVVLLPAVLPKANCPDVATCLPYGLAMTKSNEEWARWLNDALARRGWKAADLVRASGVKDNGRPVLAADVVSGYLNKGARPKPEFILVLADALGVEDMTIARASGLLREPAPSPEPARSFAEIEADMARERATREARAVNVAGLDAEDIQALNAMANRLRAAKKIDADAGAELIRQTEQLSESTLERREQLRKQRPTPRQGRKREVR